MSIIEENLQTVHNLKNDLKLDFKIFKSSVRSTVSAEQSKSRSRSNSLNKNSDDAIEKSLSDRILHSMAISASTRSDNLCNSVTGRRSAILIQGARARFSENKAASSCSGRLDLYS